MRYTIVALAIILGATGCGGASSSSNNTQSGVISIAGTWTGEFVDNAGTLAGSTAQITETITGTTATLGGSFEAGIPGSFCGPISGTLSGSVVGTTVQISGNYTQEGGGTLAFNGQSNPSGTSVSGNFSLSGGCGSTEGSAVFTKG